MKSNSVTLAAVTSGTVYGPVSFFSGFSIDSRTVAVGDLFVAIPGPNHDGHDFLSQALAVATGALVSRAVPPDALPDGKCVVRVADTLAALRAWARYVLDCVRPRVVAITGSVGKTTTKELAAEILARRFSVARTTGNRNNGIGLPLDVAGIAEGTEVAVLEMGMSTPGEIRLLSELVRPAVGVVTAVTAAHFGSFRSMDDIEHAKGEILAGMSPESVYVANAGDPRSLAIGRRHRGPVLRYGLAGETGLDAEAAGVAEEAGGTRFVLTLRGRSASVTLPLPGRHNVSNFLAAAAAASVLGVTAEEAASAAPSLRPARHRGEVRLLADDVLLYDDSYNSSPAALRAAWLAFLVAAGTRRKIAVIGEMLELGRKSRDFHFEAGRELGGRFDVLVAVRGDAAALAEGALTGSAGAGTAVFAADASEAESVVKGLLKTGDAIFVKGSRGVGLDRLVDALAARDGGSRP